jgi:transcriptional regulator with XRE-family HTH domain
MDIAATFGKNLARARRRADLSQEELSVRASVHRTEISQLERGLRIARVDTLIKLIGSLEVNPDDLLTGMDWEPGGTRIGKFKPGRSDEGTGA